jgi:nicotinamide phosphoribosyltransferase
MIPFITRIDGYKSDHRRQYPQGTQCVYSNFTPRGSRIPGQTHVVSAGLQGFLEDTRRVADETFFNVSKRTVIDQYKRRMDGYFGPNGIGTDHIAALWDRGVIPMRFYALPEGSHVPLRMPLFTFENTHPDFFWVTNYIENMVSVGLWHPCTSATIAWRYRKILDEYAERTGDPSFVQWQGHDFSYRGMENDYAAAKSGYGHLLSFTGSDTMPAIDYIEDHYDPGTELIAGSVPATEHSVMCAGGEEDEMATFNRLLNLYPTGILSVVSDTWDLWHVVAVILPALKDRIMQRQGKLVIRPDSGVPEDILCGDSNGTARVEREGLILALWHLFGGTVNEKGYKVLDPHIGAIYGDSITEDRAREICRRLEAMGFASTNVVFGIGSYTYQYVTRDTFGFAVKATWCQINGKERLLFKKPKTDGGEKTSAKGRIALFKGARGIEMRDGLDLAAHEALKGIDLLEPVWENGEFLKRYSLSDIRKRVAVGPIGDSHAVI